MLVTDLLEPQAVRFVEAVNSKKQIMRTVCQVAHDAYGIESGALFPLLIERENLGPTGVGNGIALPHARVKEVSSVRGLFVRLEKPVAYDAVDRLPVDLIFALIAPENKGVEHLKALAMVSRLMRNKNICNKLRVNQQPDQLYAILSEYQSAAAA